MDDVPRHDPASSAVEFNLCRGDLLAGMARVLDYTPGGDVPHHARVAALAVRMASRLHRIDRLDTFYAGLVHDIGLMEDPRDYSRLWDLEEQANRPQTRSHPLAGAQMVGAVPELLSVAEIILDHHEWTNGHGYPRGKSGDEIAPAAQVLGSPTPATSYSGNRDRRNSSRSSAPCEAGPRRRSPPRSQTRGSKCSAGRASTPSC